MQPAGGYFVPPAWDKNYTPIGLCYIAAVLRKKEIPVVILDLDAQKHLVPQLKEILNKLQPPVIGIQFNSETRFVGFDLVRECKRILPESIIVVGGPHISQKSVETLTHIPEIDIAVIGEGEEVFTELCYSILNGNDWSSVQAITYRDNGKIVTNPRISYIKDLDSMPTPAIDLLETESYFAAIDVGYGHGKRRLSSMITSRGCPFNCSFCTTPQNWGRKVRHRSIESIVEEIEQQVVNYNIETIQFLDDTFNVNRKFLFELCETLIAKKLKISWSCYFRADNASEETLKLMKAAGCYALLYGGESAVQKHLDSTIGKETKVEHLLTLDRLCHDIGIVSPGLFIISLPDETYEEAFETIKLAQKLKGMSSINALWILPGTQIEKIAIERNILPSEFTWTDKTVRVNSFPGIVRNIPVFFDKLSKKELGYLMYEWSKSQKNFSLYTRFREALKTVENVNDVKTLFLTGFGILNSALDRRRH